MTQTQTDALVAIRHLLEVDLHKVTWEQQQSAKTTLQAEPSTWNLILAVKAWARALAGVCRSHSAKCAEIQTGCDERDPAVAAMLTILLALCEHLRLPADPANPVLVLTAEDWPKSNRVRDFVLEVSGAPVEVIEGEIVRKAVLPRWQLGSSLTQMMGLRRTDALQAQNAAFLSVKETEKLLRELEESFRNTLWESLPDCYSEAVLATFKGPRASRAMQPGSETDNAVVTPIAPARVVSRTEPKEPVAQGKAEKTASSVEPTSNSPSNQNKREADIREVAPGAAEVKILVDTLETPADGARVVKAALRKRGMPYRRVKDYRRIKEAIAHKKAHGCSYTQASEAIFGNRKMARKIAYHYNKLKRGGQ